MVSNLSRDMPLITSALYLELQSDDKMEVQEVFPVNPAAIPPPRFSVAVSNGSVMVVPLPQGQATAAQLHQIPTHVLNEQVTMTDNFPYPSTKCPIVPLILPFL